MAGDKSNGAPVRYVADEDLHGEAVLDLALSASMSGLWRCDLDSGRVTWASQLPAVLGLPSTEVEQIQSHLDELLAPITAAARNLPVWDDFDRVQRHETPEGTARWIRLRARRTQNGVANGLLGIATDVTDEPADVREQSDLADRYRLLVELSPDAICVHQDCEIVYANPATVRFVGVNSADDLIGKPIVDFVPEDEVARLRERIAALDTPGASSAPTELSLVRADGGTLPVESMSVRTMWHGREAFQVIMRDITAQRAADEALRFRAALVSHVSDAIIATTATGEVTSWNPAAEAIYGHRENAALGRPVSELVGAELDPAATIDAGGVVDAAHRRNDGSALMMRVSAAEMNGGYVLVCSDETPRRQAEQRYSSVVMALDEGVVVLAPNGLIEAVNPAAERILGVPAHAMIGVSPTLFPVYDESGLEIPQDKRLQCTDEVHNRHVMRVKRPDGTDVWLSTNSRPLAPHAGSPGAVVTSFTDITERRAIGTRLAHAATHDSLTGLANRASLLTSLDTGLGADGRTEPVAVLFIDLDRFKFINDSLGHTVGDDVLRVVGHRLREAMRCGDIVGRLGGDEFAVVRLGATSRDQLGALAERVRDALLAPVTVGGRDLRIDTSIGIATADEGDRRKAEDLIRDADVAMYRAKSRGGCRYEFFDVELREHLQRQLRLEQDLRQALPSGQLWFAYQPIVDLRTHRTVAVEALMRWDHPTHGPISPSEFIPIAEQSDLIKHIGDHTLHATTAELASRRQQHGIATKVSVNLSARQLEDAELVDSVRAALRQTGLPAPALCLEITESALMREPNAATEVLTALRELGVRLAIDDFGTGYSSLAQLWKLPLTTLKIDREFVDALGKPGTAGAERVIKGAISTAHDLGLTVVGEGAENKRQLEILRDLGCDLAQGFYLGMPATATDLFG